MISHLDLIADIHAQAALDAHAYLTEQLAREVEE